MKRETQLKIINLLRVNLSKGFTIREMSKRLNIGYRPAHNHITKMGEEKLILVETVGRAKKITLNLDNEKTRYLLQENDLLRKERVFKKYNKIKNILEELSKKISEKFITQIQSIILFGSYAKEKATPSSDIDLLFMINNLKDKEVREYIERTCASYQHSHQIKISPIITDIAEMKKMLQEEKMNIGNEVREYGIPIYGVEQFWRIIKWAQ